MRTRTSATGRPSAYRTVVSAIACARDSSCTSSPTDHCCHVTMQPPEVVVRSTRAFRRHHAGTDRRFGRARSAEHLALPGTDDALQDLAALAGLRVGDPYPRNLEPELGVPGRELGPESERALRDEPEPAPLEVGPQLEHVGDHLQRARVAVLAHGPCVLVLHLAATVAELLQEHRHCG